MRQSMIGTGDICHKRLGYETFARQRVNNRARAMGTAFHAVLEAEGRKRMKGGTYQAPAVALKALREAVEVEGSDRFEWDGFDFDGTLLQALEGAHWYIENKWWAPDTYRVLAVEETFNLPWIETSKTKWWAHGTVDLVLEGPNGEIFLVDHKFSKNKWRAGREKPRQGPQATWYLYWFFYHWLETRGEERRFRFFYDVTSYGRGLSLDRRESAPTPYQTKVTLQKAAQYALLIDSGGPFLPNTLHYLCDHRWCDHWYDCEFGEIFNNPSAPHETIVSFRH